MKKYARYKDSGISWIGDVPEHWDVVRNKNFIDEKDEVVGEKFRDYTLLSLTKGGVIARDVESGKAAARLGCGGRSCLVSAVFKKIR